MPPLRDTPPEQRNTVSPYVDQHIGNPVDWYEWGPDAFATARARDVPIFLSVGYAACHWCHVMAHESFEDEATARYLNDHFVSIKVDREERPDIDAVYMAATTALTGSGGWPMSVWLDHEGRVFHAGTYFPPQPMRGRPSFPQILMAITDAWTGRRDEVVRSAGSIDQALRDREQAVVAGEADPDEIMTAAVDELRAAVDPVNAGFGGAPKFPPAMVLQFLLRHHENTGDPAALDMVETTCAAMARGGIHDQLAGGFARYSVDAAWEIPHFEKMLYDNALLLMVFTDLWRVTDSDAVRRVVESTADFLVTELVTPEGGFAAALDADSVPPDDPKAAAVEGAYYVWTPDQLDAVLGPDDGQWAADLFDVTVAGTFEHGTSTLTLHDDPDDWSRFARVREALRQAREVCPAPHRDDKVVAAWNGLAITALVRAGIALDRPDWVAAAVRAGEVLRELHVLPDSLLRVSRAGSPGSAPGVLEDYGHVVVAFAWLAAVTRDPGWFDAAVALTRTMVTQFHDDTGFADTAVDAEPLVRRPRDPSDNAYPSGTAAAAAALITMASLSGDQEWRNLADETLAALAELQRDHPRFAGWSLAALAAARNGPTEVAIVTGPDDDGGDLLRAAVRHGPGGLVVARGSGDTPPLLAGKSAVGRATAYVCRNFSCSAPVTRDDDLAQLLDDARVR